MKATLAAGVAAGLLIFAAQSGGGRHPGMTVPAARPEPLLDWGQWRATVAPASPAAASRYPVAAPPGESIDVVDAHWMALTMWGEARGQGEEAMRAVGHVIDNRRRAARHGAYATDTVSEAYQFSCWNPGDPNRAAIDRIDRLSPGSGDHASWLAAREIAEEILAGRSHDPTGGAAFYHASDVSPSWSEGLVPVARIGGHLFFRTARRL